MENIRSFVNKTQPSTLIASGVALLGITLLACGILSRLGTFGNPNHLVAYSLIGGGALFVLLSGFGKVAHSRRHQETQESKVNWPSSNGGKITRTFATWNIGTHSDYRIVRLKETVDKEKPLHESEVHAKRKELLKTAFTQMNQPDILCLQETDDFTTDEMLEMLPEYGTSGDPSEKCHLRVLWKESTFCAAISREMSTILMDSETYLLFNVSSAHLLGFGLNTPQVADSVELGDLEFRNLITTQAQELGQHLNIIGMDANVTREIWEPRLKIAEDQGYITDPQDNTPTLFDMNLKQPVKLDYIYAKPMNGTQITNISTLTPPSCTAFNSPANPSDHAPIIMTLTLEKKA